MFKLIKLGALAGCLALSACVTPEYQYTATGATVGGIAGAVIGHQLDHDHGRYYGGAAGALLGGAVGNSIDSTRYPNYSSGYNPPNTYSNSNPNRYPSYSNSYQSNSSNQPYYNQQNNGYTPYNRY
jgi:uncharacterized membrane protein YeaQ/YmgE (transglycosylase-associated protein family)